MSLASRRLEWPASRPSDRRTRPWPAEEEGFAVLASLVVLLALYAAATGIFIAARTELRIGLNHAASIEAFHIAEAGIHTWLAEPLPIPAITYALGRGTVRVTAEPLLAVDSITVMYHVTARASVGGRTGAERLGSASRAVRILGYRSGVGQVRPRPGLWRERF